MKKLVKKITNSVLERMFGLRIYSTKSHGREDVVDIANIGDEIGVIFDVGANIGQTTSKFVEGFPSSQIYAFEPVTKTYYAMSIQVRKHSCAKAERMGRLHGFLCYFGDIIQRFFVKAYEVWSNLAVRRSLQSSMLTI